MVARLVLVAAALSLPGAAAGRGLGAPIGSGRIGAGAGGVDGAGGYIGSIMPGPVQLLSGKSVGSSIG